MIKMLHKITKILLKYSLRLEKEYVLAVELKNETRAKLIKRELDLIDEIRRPINRELTKDIPF